MKVGFPKKVDELAYEEYRIYIRVEFRQSLGMNLVSPFQPKRKFKVYKSCKCSQYVQLDYSFEFRFF